MRGTLSWTELVGFTVEISHMHITNENFKIPYSQASTSKIWPTVIFAYSACSLISYPHLVLLLETVTFNRLKAFSAKLLKT